ncbi:MAG: hypothetical protein HOO67_01345 [Candidatus Peribacteraceae bacterium]|nr:hypothetical protein [Candidatus Peribacteraceae bacterium]
MPTAQDLAAQKRDAAAHQQKTEQLISKEKDLRRQQVTELDRQIAALQSQRSKAAAGL